MFFIGVFSTHITYIILALIYIFGYGTYALKSKKHSNEENLDIKIIAYQEPAKIDNSNTYFFYKYTSDCCEETQSNKIKLKIYYTNFLHKKLKVFDCKTWTSFNFQIPNTTRPSPLYM